jgi:hypothetical protein
VSGPVARPRRRASTAPAGRSRHLEAGAYFTQGADALRAAFIGNQLADGLVVLERGEKMGQTPHDGAPAGA